MQILKRSAIGALVIFLIINNVVAAVVHAANATISVTPTSGPPGMSVTVSSSNFASSEPNIVVTFDGNPVTPPVTANSTGGWTTTFAVPPSPSGSHIVSAQGNITLSGNATAFPFTVTPIISLNRLSGPTGTSVTVSGAGFSANETGIAVTYGSASVASGISANAQGSWSANFVIPASSGGAHTVDASGASTQASTVPDVTLSVVAGIALNNTSGAAGGSLTVTGTGFGVNEGITITYDGVVVASGFTASAQGGWTRTFNVPPSQAGSHNIDAYGSVTVAGTVPSIAFSVTPAIFANKASGASGSSITVTGSSFGAGEAGISVTYDGTSVASGISANPQGAWTATFTIPVSPAGAHTIDASGPATQATSITDIAFTVTPGISLNKETGQGGGSITVTGSGFGASEGGISVTYDGTALASGLSANSQGGWSATVTVPASPAGLHIIDASGSSTQPTNVADTTFTVTPGISVNKASGNAGGSVTVTGSGFAAGETGISVTYDGKTVASDITANPRGGWTATFVVPPSASGSHKINASGSVTQSATVSEAGFVIGAGISITPTAGHVGVVVEVSGSGFNVNSPIKIIYDNIDAFTGRLNADSTGSFSQSITIPKSQAGDHIVKVTDGEGHSAQTTFNISNTAPPAPALLAPADGGRVGFMGDATPNLKWAEVNDPSDVTYTIQISNFSDFSPVILEKRSISGTHYTVLSSEALPRGNYYWRVKATNSASVDSEWSQARLLKSGLMSPVMLVLILLIVAGAALGLWLLKLRPKTARQAAVPAPQPAPSQVVQGEWRVVESESDGGPRRLPWRLALPEAPKGARPVSTEDQARLKVILDFARSLPLVQPGHDVDWLIDLAHANDGDEPRSRIAELLLKGEIQLRYEPAWMNHPIYQDLLDVLEGQQISQDLETFVHAVGTSASEAASLLQDIYNNAASETDLGIFDAGVWPYIAAVYSDAMNWFLGRSLREPSERDYTIGTEGSGPNGVFNLSAGDVTPFAGQLIQASDEGQAARLRSLHMKLRRMYRTNEKARRLASMITQVEVQRNRLSDAFSQLGRIG